MLGMWISVHTDRSDKNGQVAAVCVSHSNLRLSLVHFNLALAEYRSAQLFTLTYQWQPLQYDPHRLSTHTHTHTLPHVILSVCQHTHTLLRDRDTFPSTHKNLSQHMLPYSPQLSVNVQNKPPLAHGTIYSTKTKFSFLQEPRWTGSSGQPVS